MKTLLHIVVLATVTLGSDLVLNHGAETDRLLRSVQPQALMNRAKLTSYDVTATLKQNVRDARPQIGLVASVD